MTPKERMKMWRSLRAPKPPWETFKILLRSEGTADGAQKKWKKILDKKSKKNTCHPIVSMP